MNALYVILMGMGIFFIVIGGVISLIFAAVDGVDVFILIPLMFVFIGIGMAGAVVYMIVKKKMIVAHGRKYAAKIYSYVDDTSCLVNGSYTVNIKVHFFDENHVEREAVIPTQFTKGSGMYPIGMTIDIYERKGKFGFDPASVRSEILSGEAELMDDKPVNPEEIKLIAVSCPNCGCSFQAAAGYSSRCPYCGGYQNV